ncbi:MAG: hypothetical protein ABI560_14610, partial [Myxococcales bacterium]
VIFDWDEQGFKNYLADPDVPAIIKAAGHVGRPQPASLGGKIVPGGDRAAAGDVRNLDPPFIPCRPD